MHRILTVEQAFAVGKRGVLVLPALPVAYFEGKVLPRMVELRLPGGSTKSVAAHFSIPHRTPPPTALELVCMLPNLELSSVPAGAEVWAELEAASQ